MTSLQIYCGLFAVTTLYAWLLSRIPQLEPDLTFVEVIIGVAICLYAAHFDLLWNGPYTSETYETQIWLAFKVGGAPIVIWQVWKLGRAWKRILEHILSRIYGNTADHAASVARKRGTEPQDGD